jgi:cyanophycinase
MDPKGTILIIGGREDKDDGKENSMNGNNKEFKHFDILKELIQDGGKKKRIEVVTTATDTPEEMIQTYKKAFRKIGYTNLGLLNITNKEEARSKKNCDRVKKAHAIFFSGGDQFRLASILGGTECINLVKQKYQTEPDFVVAGTSAGAMALPKIMIHEGGIEEALLKKDLKTASGLGIFDTCIVDTHFIKIGRFGRLTNAIINNPEALGIGLGEDSALIIKKGYLAECRGSGMVVIIDGNKINQTNIADADNETPIFLENLIVHVLSKDVKFTIKERKMDGQTKLKKESNKK